jgi:hypothetical protein
MGIIIYSFILLLKKITSCSFGLYDSFKIAWIILHEQVWINTVVFIEIDTRYVAHTERQRTHVKFDILLTMYHVSQ